MTSSCNVQGVSGDFIDTNGLKLYTDRNLSEDITRDKTVINAIHLTLEKLKPFKKQPNLPVKIYKMINLKAFTFYSFFYNTYDIN